MTFHVQNHSASQHQFAAAELAVIAWHDLPATVLARRRHRHTIRFVAVIVAVIPITAGLGQLVPDDLLTVRALALLAVFPLNEPVHVRLPQLLHLVRDRHAVSRLKPARTEADYAELDVGCTGQGVGIPALNLFVLGVRGRRLRVCDGQETAACARVIFILHLPIVAIPPVAIFAPTRSGATAQRRGARCGPHQDYHRQLLASARLGMASAIMRPVAVVALLAQAVAPLLISNRFFTRYTLFLSNFDVPTLCSRDLFCMHARAPITCTQSQNSTVIIFKSAAGRGYSRG